MTASDFKNLISSKKQLSSFSPLELALWHAGTGDWAAAHHIAQDHEGERHFDRLHAYLHRVEGDQWNAGYWYRRAGAVTPAVTTEEDLNQLIEEWI